MEHRPDRSEERRQRIFRLLAGLPFFLLLARSMEDYALCFALVQGNQGLFFSDYLFIAVQVPLLISLALIASRPGASRYLLNKPVWIFWILPVVLWLALVPMDYQSFYNGLLMALIYLMGLHLVFHSRSWVTLGRACQGEQDFKAVERSATQGWNRSATLALAFLIGATFYLVFFSGEDRGLYMDDYTYAVKATQFETGTCCDAYYLWNWRQLTHWAAGRWSYLLLHAEKASRLLHALALFLVDAALFLLIFRLSKNLVFSLLAALFCAFSVPAFEAYLWNCNMVNPISTFFGLATAHFWLSSMERKRKWGRWALSAVVCYGVILFLYDSPAPILGIFPLLALLRADLTAKGEIIRFVKRVVTVLLGAMAFQVFYWSVWMRHSPAYQIRGIGLKGMDEFRRWFIKQFLLKMAELTGPQGWSFYADSFTSGLSTLSGKAIFIVAVVAGLFLAHQIAKPAFSEKRAGRAAGWALGATAWFALGILPIGFSAHYLANRILYFPLLGTGILLASLLHFGLIRARGNVRFLFAFFPILFMIGSAVCLAGVGLAMKDLYQGEQRIMEDLTRTVPAPAPGSLFVAVPENQQPCFSKTSPSLRKKLYSALSIPWSAAGVIRTAYYRKDIDGVTFRAKDYVFNPALQEKSQCRVRADEINKDFSQIIPFTFNCHEVRLLGGVVLEDEKTKIRHVFPSSLPEKEDSFAVIEGVSVQCK